jgi:hypothetical protein
MKAKLKKVQVIVVNIEGVKAGTVKTVPAYIADALVQRGVCKYPDLEPKQPKQPIKKKKR